MAEHSSGVKLREGDKIKGYQIKKVFDPGGFAFASKAVSPSGRTVFLKKYKRPGGSSPWLQGFIDYQSELKRRIQADLVASKLCYEFVEFFDRSKAGGSVPLRAFYQVFEWVDGGSDLRGVLDELKSDPTAYDWNQRVVFARVMTAGIHAIHKAGVIHSDLKPENFYLVPDPSIPVKWKIRVIDMDFSLLEGKRAPWHGHEGYVGTPGYLSPEHLNGTVPEKGSDVFTLAIILGELLGSEHPASAGMSNYDEMAKAGSLTPIEVKQTIERVSDLGFLNHVINACLRPEASRRPTAEQLLKALNGALSEFDGNRPGSCTATPPAPSSRVEAVPPTAHAPAPPPIPSISPSEPPPLPDPVPEPTHASMAAPTPTGAPALGVELLGPDGNTIKASIPTKFGRNHLKRWGEDYEKFMSPEQFHLFRDASGNWIVEHCSYAKNATNADGNPITVAIPVRNGMVLSLGKTGKCPITLNLK